MKIDDILDEGLTERTKPVNFLLLASTPLLLGATLGVITSYFNFNVSPVSGFWTGF